MKIKNVWQIPLVVTVGQVAIFPYYIIWLKEVSLTFSLFAWMFAIFSFSAAWGFRLFQLKRSKLDSSISFIYIGMGFVYIVVGGVKHTFEYLPYLVVLLQISLGLLQGYFRAWHIEQKIYRLHVVNHYLVVGVAMIGLSFVKIVSPGVFITGFGCVLCCCGFLDFISKKKLKINSKNPVL
ncbi:hypothetical protein [Jeotgalibacillus sp. R-1-5s-1]|uniref:hypothetical protein n=1 Tax=Jeotgalibacillus sp. R-1-5s-1 TaxID=2555897 RepID=UPI00106941E5|nr:hypothetical protein [Jeotgalibacillus sp. R-1-5s-1]TFD95867.1 hypothetical protein E2491_11885 [Jeotgalibacillus sp. R-1-5s-1]